MNTQETASINNNFQFIPTETIQQPPIAETPQKKKHHRKGEYMKRLESENIQLKNAISEFSSKISIIESQNQTLMKQLEFFKNCQLMGLNFNSLHQEPKTA